MKLPGTQKILAFSKKLINKKVIITCFVLLVVFYVGTKNSQNSKNIQTTKVENKTIIQTVSASGVVHSQNEAILHFATSGKVAYINANQGDKVKKYQLIAKLDSRQLEKTLKKDLNLYLNQRNDFEDTKDSQKSQIITDALKRIAEKSQNNLNNTVIDVEIQDLALQYSNLYSPIDGYIVDNPQALAGQNVLLTDTIATVADLDNIKFTGEVDESDIAKVQTGQTTNITLDAFEDKKLESEVDTISQKAITTSTGSTAFQAFFKLQNNQKLRIGMNGTAQIEVKKSESVNSVPQEAIIEDKFVYVKSGKKFVKKEIEKGIESDTDVEITSGLEKDDIVLTSGVDELKKGSIFQKITGSVL